MAFVLLIVGAVLLISAVKGTSSDLFTLLQGDFTGSNNFIYWAVAILLIGALGYIPKVKPISVAFLGLVVLVLFLSRGDPSKAGGGFFEKFTAGLAATTAPVPDQAPGTTTAAASNSTATPGILSAIPMLPMISTMVH